MAALVRFNFLLIATKDDELSDIYARTAESEMLAMTNDPHHTHPKRKCDRQVT
jgi:hypothetical protein